MSDEINECLNCGTIFIRDDKYKDWNWFTCENCGTDYHKENGKWVIDE